MRIISLILFFLISLIINSLAQDFGEISDDVLQMTEFSQDPEADAVILFDKADVRITNYFDLEVIRHIRIKVLTEAGKEYADIEIPVWYEDDFDVMDAASFSPDGEEYELDSDNIFEEEAGIIIKYSFPIPGVVIGSVIEYKFRILSDYISKLEPWYFQDEAFTVLSQYSVVIPMGFTYSKLSKNIALYEIYESVDEVRDPDNYENTLTQFTWTGRNVPGMKDIPFIDNLYDKYASMMFILNSYKSNYQNVVFGENWNSIADRISSRYYNDLIEEDGLSESTLPSIIGAETNDLVKAKMIYNYVRSEIKTTEHKYLISSNFKTPENVIADKTGSTSEKNILLINLLNLVGLNANPVLISTRKHGEVNQGFCNPDQFNRLICLLRIGKKSYFLHAGVKFNPFGYLTPATDVGIGLLIEDDKGTIINLKPIKPSNRISIKTSGNISEDGVITADTKINFTGFAALRERNALEDEEIEKYVTEKVKTLFDEAVLDTFYYTGIDSIESPLILNLSYTLPEFIERTDKLAYFSPPLFSNVLVNPFTSSKRYYSVDFDFNLLTKEEIKLSWDDNFAVLEVPKLKKTSMSDFSYNQIYFSGQNYVECMRIEDCKKRRIHVKNYSRLRNIYDEMVFASEDQVVLSIEDQNDESSVKINPDEK